jgi:hypothetical protein
MLLYYLRAIIITALLTNSNHLEVQAKQCAVYPYLGITLFFASRGPRRKASFHMCLFPVANGYQRARTFTVGFHIPLIRDQDISGRP